MKQPAPIDTTPFAASLQLRRQSVLADIQQKLHGSDDPSKLAFFNHLEAVGDWIEADLFNDIDIAILEKELGELRDLDTALLRIQAGTYGICTDCSESISPHRLHALPTAHRCVICQRNFEKHHGTERHALL